MGKVNRHMTASHIKESFGMGELKGRVALVTGGSRGIGKAISLALAEAGVVVAVNCRERVNDADAVAREIREHNGRAEVFSCDVSLGSSVQAMVWAIEERLGLVDILVNNAGIAASHGNETTEEDFDRTISINLKSAFLCTEAVLPGMRQRHWGRIINLSAMGARAGSRSIAYGTAKAGLEGLTRSYALQLAKEGVTVNAVAPGLIETEMTRTLIDYGSAIARVPTGRAGTPDEIAQAVLLVVTNGYITGQTISVNGGASFA
jgi:3-oxoacyl-[acyl-carrier protein] reductase